MKSITLLSYPSDQSNLLSLCDHSSRYELYFAGRFRILDFILSIGLSLSVEDIILLEPNFYKTLESFSQQESTLANFPPINVTHVEKAPTIPGPFVLKLAEESKSEYFLVMNGDNPIIADLREAVESFISEDKNHGVMVVEFENIPNNRSIILLIKRQELVNILANQSREITSYLQLFNSIINGLNKEQKINLRKIHGYCRPINSIVEYFEANMDMIRHLKAMIMLTHFTPLGNIIPLSRNDGLIKKDGNVVNSILSDGCKIEGEVINSILFPNVSVGANARVENSILLPNTNIADKSILTRCIVDETFDETMIKKNVLSISEESIIGREDQFCRNTIYPNAIYNGITLIGPNCALPKKLRVGAGCYVKAATDKLILKKNDIIKDCGTV